MAENQGKWPSNRGLISKIRPSDGCGKDAVPLAVGKSYDFHKFGCHLGNVGLSWWARIMAPITDNDGGTAMSRAGSVTRRNDKRGPAAMCCHY